jgi:Bromodomain
MEDPSQQHRNTASRKLLELLLADKSSRSFKVLPDIMLYPYYYQVISRPISLADIGMLISASRYSFNEMQKDLRRMIGNAKKFNVPDSEVYQDALVMEVSRPRQGFLRQIFFIFLEVCTYIQSY